MPGTVTTGSGSIVWAAHHDVMAMPRTANAAAIKRTRVMSSALLLARLADGGPGFGNDLIDAKLPQGGRGAARIAADAGGAAAWLIELVGAHHRRIDRHQQ